MCPLNLRRGSGSPAAASASLIANKPVLEDTSCHPLFSIGFRPFFLGAALMAVLWVPLWLWLLQGGRVTTHFPPVLLHAHEMLFGFTTAVIAGFLLTAGANWSGRPTTNGPSLLGLFLFWLLGRLAMLTPGAPPLGVAIVDVGFLPVLSGVLATRLVAAKSQKNYQFLGMLLLLSLSNALIHAEASGIRQVRPGLGHELALRTITLMMLVMGGRLIPLFTRNATGKSTIGSKVQLERAGLVSFLLASSVDLLEGPPTLRALLWLFAGVVNLARMKAWGTTVARAPLLWSLHAGYFAVALSLVLEGCAAAGLVASSIATHTLTVGGIGGLCLAMMTRVSLGHSGRMLAAPKTMTAAFALLLGAALARVLGPSVSGHAMTALLVSGLLWTAAFLLLLRFGWPIWTRARADAPANITVPK